MNFEYNANTPLLIEPGVKYFLGETLRQCHKVRESYNNQLFNIMLFMFFIFVLASLLIYKYKGKLTPEELEHNDSEKKQYILSKIKNYQQDKVKEQQELITGLPHWENEYESDSQALLKKLR